ncbi:DUF1905 domain-containing protein [Limnovirga soli]|uniref:DUF1905 domain-containing protein n=1 Tax=Limnovirga soli TaxID=2656915 RepID=A0A8J8JT70_9BACT|nr:DUF1905 domain-containing protein [Limnovirga soli]NNV55578.1 DUF1905 domain-containing protein [Limnovirga soli]
MHATHSFRAQIQIVGVNPYVLVPEDILQAIFIQAGKKKGNIPVKGTINQQAYTQTLVKYNGIWRFYVNTAMLKNSPKRIGELVDITIVYDAANRTIAPHPTLEKALLQNKEAALIFSQLRPSLQLEIVRYIAHLKTAASVERNVEKAIGFLLGQCRFIGRDKP